ncbi:hypothetical protein B4N89_13520 [Embleya scabrispora]|uniref:Uncharacterized protein n=1 Tax=Embleya scabrispora TaxID=159449 RepID=A0A1T3NYB2_9ACTN|nr:hypothetical protein [Embleya scabrispora]OPC81819.1 hypothetical protein B4N89_13520 [Embleya scabrispora]
MGPVEEAVQRDIEALGDLVGVEASLSEMAYAMARGIDEGGGEDGRLLAGLNRELRATLAALLAGRMVEEDDDGLGDLAAPD